MKLCTLVGSISRLAGGLHQSVRRLSQEIHDSGRAQVCVLGIEDRFSAEDLAMWEPLRPQLCAPWGPRSFGYSPYLRCAIQVQQPEILHVHGIWQYLSMAAHGWHRKADWPYVMSPRGMLDPWALNHGRLKKLVAFRFFEQQHLNDARCVHSLCHEERDAIRALGVVSPICTIPNGVDLPGLGDQASDFNRRPRLLFLGRIHPKKGLEPTMRAWKNLLVNSQRREMSWQLLIAGWDQREHEQFLETLCGDLCLRIGRIPAHMLPESAGDGGRARDPDTERADVLFVGPVHGTVKDQLLRNVEGFILPSFSEGLPMAVLEAWSYGLPAIITPHCHLPLGAKSGAALEFDPTERSLARGLHEFMDMSDDQRYNMGRKGRTLVEQHFTWPLIAQQMADVYEWVLGGGSPPVTVEVR